MPYLLSAGCSTKMASKATSQILQNVYKSSLPVRSIAYFHNFDATICPLQRPLHCVMLESTLCPLQSYQLYNSNAFLLSKQWHQTRNHMRHDQIRPFMTVSFATNLQQPSTASTSAIYPQVYVV